jgi:GNAT superfamily N-acetyltransferase
MSLETRILTLDDVTAASHLLAHLNPNTPLAILAERFERILKEHAHYHPLGAFLDGKLVGVVGAWIATKIWCGRYLEVDNIVVDPEVRSEGIGTALIQAVEEVALQHACQLLVLDSYTSNHPSHRLYHRLGFEIWGFHFVKPLPGFTH